MTDEPSAAETLFWALAEALQADDPGVTEGTIMRGRCLRVDGEFLALPNFKGSGMVVKLSRERVEALISEGVGRPFAPAGRVFREWVAIEKADPERWSALLQEGVALARGR